MSSTDEHISQTTGDSVWFIDKNQDNCARSGEINDNEYSELKLRVNVLDATIILFDVSVSSEKDYDILTFFIDDSKMSIYSNQNWRNR